MSPLWNRRADSTSTNSLSSKNSISPEQLPRSKWFLSPSLFVTFHGNDESMGWRKEKSTGIDSAHIRETEFPEDDRGASPNKEGLVLSPMRTLPRERKISWRAPLTYDKIHGNVAPLLIVDQWMLLILSKYMKVLIKCAFSVFVSNYLRKK